MQSALPFATIVFPGVYSPQDVVQVPELVRLCVGAVFKAIQG